MTAVLAGAAVFPQPRELRAKSECRAGDANRRLGQAEDHAVFEHGRIGADQLLVVLVNLNPLVVAPVELFGDDGEVIAGLHAVLGGWIESGLSGRGGGLARCGGGNHFVAIGQNDMGAGAEALRIDIRIGADDVGEVGRVAIFSASDGPEALALLDDVAARAARRRRIDDDRRSAG